MAELNSAVWDNEPGWLQKKRQLAALLVGRFPQQRDQEKWLQPWQRGLKARVITTGLLRHDGDYVAQPLNRAVNEYSEMLQENLMEKALPWQGGQLNAAHLSRIDSGQFIYVPNDVPLAQPICLTSRTNGSNPHNVIVVGAGSRVTIQETATFTNSGAVYAGTELLMGADATVTYRQFNHFAAGQAYQAVHAYQAQGAHLRLEYGQDSQTNVTSSIYSFLDGPQARWETTIALRACNGYCQQCYPVLDGYGQDTRGRLRVVGQAVGATLQVTPLRTGSGEPLDMAEKRQLLTADQDFGANLVGSWLENQFPTP